MEQEFSSEKEGPKNTDARRQYAQPRLIRVGTVEELTNGNFGLVADGFLSTRSS